MAQITHCFELQSGEITPCSRDYALAEIAMRVAIRDRLEGDSSSDIMRACIGRADSPLKTSAGHAEPTRKPRPGDERLIRVDVTGIETGQKPPPVL